MTQGQAVVPTSTASRGSRIVGAITLVGVAALAWLGLVVTPPEVVQGESVRLFYVHVPMAIMCFAAFLGTAIASGLYLWRKSQFWDLFAEASAEIGVLFTALTLVVGALWGRPTWGVWWVWDARLTTTAMLLVLYLGYLAVRRLPGDPAVVKKRAAIVGIIAYADVPIVYYSVEWWRTLHQEATITRLDPEIDGLMLFTAALGLVVFVFIYWWLMIHRFRVAWLREQVEHRSLDDALAERRAEGDRPLVPAGDR